MENSLEVEGPLMALPRLSDRATRILTACYLFFKESRGDFPKAREIEEKTQVPARQVPSYISELIKKGFLVREQNPKRYIFTTLSLRKMEQLNVLDDDERQLKFEL